MAFELLFLKQQQNNESEIREKRVYTIENILVLPQICC